MSQNYKHKYEKYKSKYMKQRSDKIYQSGGQIDDLLIDEIHFWSNQMKEHSNYMYMGLENKKLKKLAFDFFKEWESYVDNTFVKKDVDEEKIFLDKNDIDKIGNIDKNIVLEKIERLKKFKEEIIMRLTNGEWLGWLWKSFINHILRELIYFEDKLNGKIFTHEEEVAFWNVTDAEHVGNASHLLDPTFDNDDLIKKANELYHEFNNLGIGEKKQFITLSLRYNQELNDFNKKTQKAIYDNEVESIINKDLINHIVRENTRGIAILKKLEE